MNKICPQCDQLKSFNDFGKNKESKDGKQFWCKNCKNIKDREYYFKNKEKIDTTTKEYRRKNKEKISKYQKEYYKKNKKGLWKSYYKETFSTPEKKEEYNASRREYYFKNKERINATKKEKRLKDPESHRQQQRNKYLKNRDKILKELASPEGRAKANAINAKRRAMKLKATPSWANFDIIKNFYKEAKRLEKETGIKYHVDHIIPLQGNNVCGFHVETNLQVITAEENFRKHNTYEV